MPGSSAFPGIRSPLRAKFSTIWKLVKMHRFADLPPEYSDELLVAIMWEESTFCNIREVRNGGRVGPAVGYGQINDSEFWRFPQYKKAELTARVLQSPEFSVQFIGMFLHDLHKKLNGNRAVVLKFGYAGVNVNPINLLAYNGWLDCEQKLKQFRREARTRDGYWVPTRADLKQALKAAKPNAELFLDEVLEDIQEPKGRRSQTKEEGVRSEADRGREELVSSTVRYVKSRRDGGRLSDTKEFGRPMFVP